MTNISKARTMAVRVKKPVVAKVAKRIVAAAGSIKGKPGLHAEKRPVKGHGMATRYVKNTVVPKANGKPEKAAQVADVTAEPTQNLRQLIGGKKRWTRVTVDVPGHGVHQGFVLDLGEDVSQVRSRGDKPILTVLAPRVGKNGLAVVRTNDASGVVLKDHQLAFDPDELKNRVPVPGSWVTVKKGKYKQHLPSGAVKVKEFLQNFRARLASEYDHPSGLVLLEQVGMSTGRKPVLMEVKRNKIVGPAWVDKHMQNIPDHALTLEALRKRKPAFERPPLGAKTKQEASRMIERQRMEDDEWLIRKFTGKRRNRLEEIQRVAAGVCWELGFRSDESEDVEDIKAIAEREAWKALRVWRDNPAKQMDSYCKARAEFDTRKNWRSEKLDGPREAYAKEFYRHYLYSLSEDQLVEKRVIAAARSKAKAYAKQVYKKMGFATSPGEGLPSMMQMNLEISKYEREHDGEKPGPVVLAQRLGWRMRSHDGEGWDVERVKNLQRQWSDRQQGRRDADMPHGEDGEEPVGALENVATEEQSVEVTAESAAEEKRRDKLFHKLYVGAKLPQVERVVMDYHRKYDLTHPGEEGQPKFYEKRTQWLVSHLNKDRKAKQKEFNAQSVRELYESAQNRMRVWASNPDNAWWFEEFRQIGKAFGAFYEGLRLLGLMSPSGFLRKSAIEGKKFLLHKSSCVCGSHNKATYTARGGGLSVPVSVCRDCGTVRRLVKKGCDCGRLERIEGLVKGTKRKAAFWACNDCGRVHNFEVG